MGNVSLSVNIEGAFLKTKKAKASAERIIKYVNYFRTTGKTLPESISVPADDLKAIKNGLDDQLKKQNVGLSCGQIILKGV